MKINVGVLFGGRSVENEISVVTALQAMEAMDREKYEIIPIYIAKTGKWYTGDALLEMSNYKDMDKLYIACKKNDAAFQYRIVRGYKNKSLNIINSFKSILSYFNY